MWYAAASVKSALVQADVLWPNRSHASDGIIGDAAHSASVSDHNPDGKGCVHAFDLTHDPGHGVDTFEIADDLRARAEGDRDFRRVIKYVISNRRIYNPSISPAWRVYSGSSPHTDHVHVSINYTPEAENWSGQWWGKQGGEEVTDADLKKIEAALDKKLAPIIQRLSSLEARFGEVDATNDLFRALYRKVGPTVTPTAHDVFLDTQAIRKKLDA